MISRLHAILGGASLLLAATAMAQDANAVARVVFEGGRSTPVTNIMVRGDQYVAKAALDGFTAGQAFPKALANYVQGEKPSGVDEGISLILQEKPLDALKLLEPIVEEQKATASIPGNLWMEPARATLIAYALIGSSDKCLALGQAISDATPEPGNDPIVALGRALLLPFSTSLDARLGVLNELVSENNPADVSAFASFFRGIRLKKAKREKEALEAYLLIPCVYPTGGSILTAVAEMNAAEILAARKGQREEAVALLISAARNANSTSAGAEAQKRLKSLQ